MIRVAHWTLEYPHPVLPHSGHAIQRVVATLRRDYPDDEQHVYCFRRSFGSRVLSPFSERYRQIRRLWTESGFSEHECNVPIPILPRLLLDRWVNPIWQSWWLKRFGASLNWHVLHVHHCRSLSWGAVLAGLQSNRPVVLTFRREMMLEHQPLWRQRFLIDAARKASKLLAPSAHLMRRAREATGLEVELVPSGTDVIFDEPPSPEIARETRILFVGRLDANKAGHLLVRTVLELNQQGQQVGLDLIGEGPEAPALRELAAGASCVRFLGQKSALEVREHMRRSLILCVPSYTETLGLVFLEAMKQGMAVVGRAETGIDGMGERGKHYEVIDRDEDLHPLLQGLLRNPERCRKLGRQSQALASQWTWDNNARRHRDIYHSLVSARKGLDSAG
jgi:glycosyltransferase involved in cell wall biosynthesis